MSLLVLKMEIRYPLLITKNNIKRIWETNEESFLLIVNEIVDKIKEKYQLTLNCKRIITMFIEFLACIHIRLPVEVVSFRCELEEDHLHLMFVVDEYEIACSKVFYSLIDD